MMGFPFPYRTCVGSRERPSGHQGGSGPAGDDPDKPVLHGVEAIEGEGKIRVQTRNADEVGEPVDEHTGLKPGHYFVLRVEDTVCGMSEDTQAKVFEPFFSTIFQGRGLGLASIYGIVTNHGGHISLESKEGQGGHHRPLGAAEFGIAENLDSEIPERTRLSTPPALEGTIRSKVMGVGVTGRPP